MNVTRGIVNEHLLPIVPVSVEKEGKDWHELDMLLVLAMPQIAWTAPPSVIPAKAGIQRVRSARIRRHYTKLILD